MKNNFFNLQSLLTVTLCAIMSLSFAACSDDDDEPNGNDLIKIVVGTWAQNGDNDIFTINTNGTGAWYESPNDFQNDEVGSTLNWSYNDGWINITMDYYGSPQIEKMRAESVSQNKIVWKRYAIPSEHYDPSEDEWDGHDSFGYYDFWTWERYTK